VGLESGDGKVMEEVTFNLLSVHRFHVASTSSSALMQLPKIPTQSGWGAKDRDSGAALKIAQEKGSKVIEALLRAHGAKD